jgi:hypothetical protein
MSCRWRQSVPPKRRLTFTGLCTRCESLQPTATSLLSIRSPTARSWRLEENWECGTEAPCMLLTVFSSRFARFIKAFQGISSALRHTNKGCVLGRRVPHSEKSGACVLATSCCVSAGLSRYKFKALPKPENSRYASTHTTAALRGNTNWIQESGGEASWQASSVREGKIVESIRDNLLEGRGGLWLEGPQNPPTRSSDKRTVRGRHIRMAANCEVEVPLRLTVGRSVGQSVCPGVEPILGLVTRYYFLSEGWSESCGLVSVGSPLWREDGSAVCSAITQWSESRRTCNHNLLSYLRLPQPGAEGFHSHAEAG